MNDEVPRYSDEPDADGSATVDIVLEALDLTLAYGEHQVSEDLSVQIPRGAITVIVGANACGKSTLLRALARLLNPLSGSVHLDGDDLYRIPTRHVATKLGILPQSPIAPDGITVADLVARGRYPHQGWFRRWNAGDEAALEHALRATSTLDLADRSIDELSGGQRQRVWIAMAIAQDTEVLLLDEPTTFLDLAHQIDVMELLVELNAERGTTIVAVLHDLNQAFRYAQHIIAMRAGSVVAQGPPTELATEDLIHEVFDMSCQIIDDPVSHTPMVVPIGRRQPRTTPEE